MRQFLGVLATDWPLYVAAGTICETGETDETGENVVVGVVVEQIEFLTGLTGLPLFSPVPPRIGFRTLGRTI